jgi:hypothetical protein
MAVALTRASASYCNRCLSSCRASCRHKRRNGGVVRGSGPAFSSAHLLSPERGCRQPRPVRAYPVFACATWKWAFLHQLIAHRVLEPASTCGSHGGQFEQRHYGVGFVCPTYRQRGYAATGKRAGQNVLDAEPLATSVLQQLRKAEMRSFRESLSGMTNPYGDGHAAERIVRALTTVPPRDRLLLKLDSEALSA